MFNLRSGAGAARGAMMGATASELRETGGRDARKVSLCCRRCRGRRLVAGSGSGLCRRTDGAGGGLRSRHRRDASQSGAGRLADVAPHRRRLGLQPARPGHARQRRCAAHGLVACAGFGQPGRDAPGIRGRPVHAEPQRRHPGDRRGHGRPALGIPARPSGRRRRVRRRLVDQPQHRHLRLQHHRYERRRLRLCPRCNDRAARLGDRDPRLHREPGPALVRPHRGGRQGDLRPELPPAGRARGLRHHDPRRGDRGGGLAAAASSPHRGSRATRRGAASRSRSACTSARGWPRATTRS